MHKVLLLIFTLFCTPLYAEEPDTILMSIHYIANFKTYNEDNSLCSEEKVLDIARYHSNFYGRWQRRREEITDSISKIGGSVSDLMNLIYDYPRPRQLYSIYDNYPLRGKRTVTDQEYEKFKYEEDITPIRWNLLQKDTIILNTPCQFATCSYGGRMWTACFAPSIPIQEGPWKLKGLPGLILYAYDASGIFSFECIEMRNAHKAYVAPSLDKYLPCSREELNKLKTESAANPQEYVKRFGIVNHGYGSDGKPLVYPKRTPALIEN